MLFLSNADCQGVRRRRRWMSLAVTLAALGAAIGALLTNHRSPVVHQDQAPAPPSRLRVVYCIVEGDGQLKTVRVDKLGHVTVAPCPDGFSWP